MVIVSIIDHRSYPDRPWILIIAFVCDIGVCVCVCVRVCVCVCVYACVYVCFHPEAIKYIHVILSQYNQLSKFVAVKNITYLSMHGCGLYNETCHDRNQPNKAMLAPQKLLVSLRGWF